MATSLEGITALLQYCHDCLDSDSELTLAPEVIAQKVKAIASNRRIMPEEEALICAFAGKLAHFILEGRGNLDRQEWVKTFVSVVYVVGRDVGTITNDPDGFALPDLMRLDRHRPGAPAQEAEECLTTQ